MVGVVSDLPFQSFMTPDVLILVRELMDRLV